MKIIVIKTKNKYLGISTPAANNLNDVELNQLAISIVPTNTEYKIIDCSTLPKIDSVFFDCVLYDTLKPDISKAKEIWYEEFRKVRRKLFEKLDVEFMRAVETSDLPRQSEIAAQKQALRDVTNTELPNTIEGIKSTWPEILGPNPFITQK